MQGIDPRTSRMLSDRSNIWATSPLNKEFIERCVNSGVKPVVSRTVSENHTRPMSHVHMVLWVVKYANIGPACNLADLDNVDNVCRNSSVGRALDWRFKSPWFNPVFRQIPYGLVARIPGFHPGGSGSIPGMGKFWFFLFQSDGFQLFGNTDEEQYRVPR